jgi:hypothetical protein
MSNLRFLQPNGCNSEKFTPHDSEHLSQGTERPGEAPFGSQETCPRERRLDVSYALGALARTCSAGSP